MSKPKRIMMSNEKIFGWIKSTVADYGNAHTEPESDPQVLAPEDVFITWFCKTLQNWKALAATDRLDGIYYELTYNGDKQEVYMDTYEKTENQTIAFGDYLRYDS